jgi:rRNA-processing protein FCF1
MALVRVDGPLHFEVSKQSYFIFEILEFLIQQKFHFVIFDAVLLKLSKIKISFQLIGNSFTL